ncbi:MAG: helix-turn-helix transcriptional regulator [Oscillospiraceae bacterium]|nr:helix-turn-helix transcriptional regulator [Oscillospiraceae bacterium]
MIKIHLSRILGEKRMSQAELSRQTGIRPSTISDIYNEITERLNIDHLDRICEYLDCDITDLIEYIPNAQKKTGEFLIKEEHGNCKK